jgi:hypothetical protein
MRRLVLLASVAATASGCGADKAAGTCPADFETFLERFMRDRAVQVAALGEALIDSHVEDAEPEPRTVRRVLVREAVKLPVMPSPEEQREYGLVPSIRGAQSKTPVVVLAKPDTDFQITYRFRRDACWTLVERNDQSL